MKSIKEKNQEIILNGSIYNAIAIIAIPSMVNSLLQTAYNLTDTFWLGHIGSNELAAINLVSPVQNIITNFGNGITVAGSVLIAQYIGAREREKAKTMAAQIYVVATIFSVLAALFCFLITPALVVWLGAEGDVRTHASTYLQLVVLNIPLLFTTNVYAAINQAQGDAVHPMKLNLIGTAANLIMDPLFIVWLKMGPAGAAIATVASSAIPAIIAIKLLFAPKDGIKISLKGFKFIKEEVKKIVTIGLPTSLGGSVTWVGFLLMSKNVLVYGPAAMAAYGISNKCNGVATLPINGVGSAVATIVGQNMGAGQVSRAEQAYKKAMYFGMIFLGVSGFIISRDAVSSLLVGVFSEDVQVRLYAADFLAVMSSWCWMNSVNTCTSGLFQGSGYTHVNMVVDISRLWVFRFATLFLFETVFDMGVRSIWYCVVISNALTALVYLSLYFVGFWKKSRFKKAPLKVSAKTNDNPREKEKSFRRGKRK